MDGNTSASLPIVKEDLTVGEESTLRIEELSKKGVIFLGALLDKVLDQRIQGKAFQSMLDALHQAYPCLLLSLVTVLQDDK